MATTTNYGWTTPDDTALVKDGASAIRTLGSSVDTTTKNLNPETTLGDISFRSSTSNVNTRLGIGSNGQFLSITSGIPAWVAAPSSSGPAFLAKITSNQSVTQNVDTKVTFNSEVFDTDNCYDATTNFRFTPTKAGIYQVNAGLRITGSTADSQYTVNKNGTAFVYLFITPSAQSGFAESGATLIELNGTTDYIEMFGFTSMTSPAFTPTGSFFSAVWIRS